METMNGVIIGAQLTLMEKLCYIGDRDAKDSLYSKLEKCIVEMRDTGLHMEEREFAMQRATHIMGELHTLYRGAK